MRTVEDLNHRRVELNDLGGGGDSDRRSVQEAEGVASSADRATEWARGAAGGVELEEWLLLAYGRGGYGSRRRGGLRRAAADRLTRRAKFGDSCCGIWRLNRCSL